jgi:flagellar basal-body rod protein FlgG
MPKLCSQVNVKCKVPDITVDNHKPIDKRILKLKEGHIMLRVLWTSRTALMANTEKMDAISNNMANAQTQGYKQVDVSFEDLVGESLDRLGYPASKASTLAGSNSTGTGVKTTNWVRDNTQGSLTNTGVSGDLAIDGDGYYQLTSPSNQKVYTRAGSFSADANGRLADSNGNLLNINFDKGYNSGNVKFTDNNYQVSENGDVLLKDNNNSSKKVGNIELYNVTGSNGFLSAGNNLYVPDANAKVYKSTNAAIRQGYTENSNVDIGSEMADMIVTQRAFELASKGIQAADSMWGIANNLKSK